MLKRTVFSICLVGAACTFPMQAQSQNEEGTLNFSAGGGLSVPVNPTANYAGVGGNFIGGGGYNLDQHNSIVGQFQWDGLRPSILSPTLMAIAQINGFSSRVNLYSMTADYKYRNSFGKTFGYYLIAGGGWYYRHSSVSKSTFIPTTTVCQPVWYWYGYTCSNGYVNTVGVAGGTSAFGGNGGVGLTIRVKGTGWKFFIESRYNYAATRFISTQVAPVTFGFAYQ
jgi:hypothetical protein